MDLSTHFSLSEFVTSQTAERLGIDNTPPQAVMRAILRTATGMEGVRTLLCAPIIISSGYRSPALNKSIGGASNSQHMKGEAVDFICPGYGSPLKICKAIVASGIKFDQLIQEGKWVHISFSDANRREVLTANFDPAGATYIKGLA